MAVLCALPLCGTAAPAGTFPVQLSSHDRGALSRLACASTGAPELDRLEAWTTKRGSGRITVELRCKPHATLESLPLARYVNCDNLTGLWTCGEGRDALMMTLSNASVLAVLPGTVAAHTAIEVVGEAAQLSVPPFHGPALPWLADKCVISQRDAAEFKGATHFRLECTPGVIQLTRDCWQNKCRYFIVGGSKT
jgi:hypothetical protein